MRGCVALGLRCLHATESLHRNWVWHMLSKFFFFQEFSKPVRRAHEVFVALFAFGGDTRGLGVPQQAAVRWG